MGQSNKTFKIMYKYIEVKDWSDCGVVRRLDVSSKCNKEIDKIKDGIDRNINTDKYYTVSFESKVEHEIIK